MARPTRWALSLLPLCALCAQANAQDLSVDTALELQTTYIFRGEPQYARLESPCLQLRGDLEWGLGASAAWVQVQATSALNERALYERQGSADEFNLLGAWRWALADQWALTTGGVVYLRPHNEPADLREEVMLRLDASWGELREWTLTPYVAAYGEVHRLLGVYVEGGVVARRALGEGVDLSGYLRGGGAWYQEGDAQFNHVAFSLEMGYQALPGLRVGARVSGAISQRNIEYGEEFLTRHAVAWSGLLVEYTPTAPR